MWNPNTVMYFWVLILLPLVCAAQEYKHFGFELQPENQKYPVNNNLNNVNGKPNYVYNEPNYVYRPNYFIFNQPVFEVRRFVKKRVNRFSPVVRPIIKKPVVEKPVYQDQLRLLDGRNVIKECTYKGISIIAVGDLNEQQDQEYDRVCTAVNVRAPVNGEVKQTFFTPNHCKYITETWWLATFYLEIGDRYYRITDDMFQLEDGDNGNAFITVRDEYSDILRDLGRCQTPACPYNDVFMKGLVNFTDCRMVGYWSTNRNHQSKHYLQEAEVYLNPDGCGTILDRHHTNNTLCFSTSSGKPIAECLERDTGSPVYCRAPSNGEDILIGLTIYDAYCSQHSDVKVTPVPAS